jgi:hypothetical protein
MFAIKLYFGDNPSPTFNDHRVTNQNNGCFWDNIYLFVQMFIWLRPDLVTLLCMTNFVYISVSVQIDAAAEFVNKNWSCQIIRQIVEGKQKVALYPPIGGLQFPTLKCW